MNKQNNHPTDIHQAIDEELAKHSQPSSVNSPKSNSRGRPRKILVAVIISLVLMTTTALADIPVHDEINRIFMVLGFAKDLEALVTQYNYWVVINGHWKEQLKIYDDIETIAAANHIPIDKLGWAAQGRFSQEKATQIVADALDELQKFKAGKASNADLAKLQENVELIYSPAPVTTDGAKSENALREIAKTEAFVNQSQKSIEENLKNVAQIREALEAGGLPPDDVKRYETMLVALQQEIELNKLQGQNHLLSQQAAQLGLQTAESTDKVNGRLQERWDRLELMKTLMLSPKIKSPADETKGVD